MHFRPVVNVLQRHPYVRLLVRTNTVVRSIKKEVFAQLMTEKNLWPELTKVLSWYICMLKPTRDVLVARSAYSVVPRILYQINDR